MATRQCYHCRETVVAGEPHDCWTTTEAALTADLSDDLQEAWERFRESAAELGDQRIYASHNSIMFSRRCCYAFVRPKRRFLEVCIFLPREVHAPPVRKVQPSSRTKFAHLLRITHRDQVEAPVTDWLAEAYALAGLARTEQRVASDRARGAAAPTRPARVEAAPAPRRSKRPRRA